MLCFSCVGTLVSLWYQGFGEVGFLRECTRHVYKGYKSEVSLEKYLINLSDDLRICMSKFRMCNQKLPIELGRHNNIERNLRQEASRLLRSWHLLGNPPKNTTIGKDLLFNEGIRLLNMIDSFDMKLYRFHNLDSTFEVIQRLYLIWRVIYVTVQFT